jgi:hypothetical protein
MAHSVSEKFGRTLLANFIRIIALEGRQLISPVDPTLFLFLFLFLFYFQFLAAYRANTDRGVSRK